MLFKKGTQIIRYVYINLAVYTNLMVSIGLLIIALSAIFLLMGFDDVFVENNVSYAFYFFIAALGIQCVDFCIDFFRNSYQIFQEEDAPPILRVFEPLVEKKHMYKRTIIYMVGYVIIILFILYGVQRI